MKTRFTFMLLLIASLALSGCGKESSTDKAAGSASVGAIHGQVPSDLPDDVPDYPGIHVTNTFPSEQSLQILALSGDKADEIADFYVKKMQTNGWTQETSWYTSSHFLVFTKDRRQVALHLIPGAPQGAETAFALTIRFTGD